jgi:2-succinyl-6-hydroxy-2,4-cyclohexadiene-1-carboxylate synthase
LRCELRLGTSLVVLDDVPGSPPSVAEPLVLLHGFSGSRRTWEGLAAALAPARRVIAPDLPGHGESRGSDLLSLDGTAALLLEALDRIGVGRFALAGYSMGGRLALRLALEMPERVTRLVLESASPGIEDAVERSRRRAADEALARSIEEEGVAAFVARWEALPLFATQARLPSGRRDALRAIRLAQRAEGLAASLRHAGVGTQPWLGARLGELAMPVLLVAGEEDAKFTALARAMATAIRDVRVAILPGAGHAPHLERPAAFRGALRSFLSQPSSSGLEENRCSTGRP